MIGMAVARPATLALSAFAPSDIPQAALASSDGRAVPYALGLVVVLSLVCALVPAAHLRSGGMRNLMGKAARGHSRRRRALAGALVAGQVAFATMLAIGGGLASRSLDRLNTIDYGFSVDELLVVTVRRPVDPDSDDDARAARVRRVLDELAAIPGVRAVSASEVLPLTYSIDFGTPYLDGDDPPASDDGSYSHTATSAPGFLAATGLRIVAGRDFTDDERAAERPRVVLVNRGFAERYPESVIGRSILFPGDSVSRRIVGVVTDVRTGNVRDATVRAQVYYPSNGVSRGTWQRYLLQAADPFGTLGATIRDRVSSVDPRLVTSIESGSAMVAEKTADGRVLAIILGLLALLSTGLALAGVYGAVTLSVGRRVREVGIRMALGAQPGRVVRSVIARAMGPVGLGLAIGLGAAGVAVTYLSGVLYEIAPRDPMSFLGAGMLLAAAAALAALIPAQRAAGVDPTQSLRSE